MTFIKCRTLLVVAGTTRALLCVSSAQAVTIVFFNASQTTNHMASGATSETISSSGYLFSYSQDKWWSATGSGPPTGRFSSVNWPAGLDAQTQTAGPSGPLANQIPATITIKRIDGLPFALTTFTAKILGSTAAAGGAFEIMPLLNGSDGFANPLTLDCTGYSGATFTYNTPELTGFDTYNISMWMDYGLLSLTVADASLPPPALRISQTSSNDVRLYWPTNSTGYMVQQNFNLGTTNWVNITNPVSIVGTNNQNIITATNGARFFRLKQP